MKTLEKDYHKITYAQLLSVSDNQQITQHLDNVNKKGDLILLISGIINFWIDNANDVKHAQNADLALRKLATILDNVEIQVIESILDNIHEHEIKDKLTFFLVKDIDRLLNIHHKRKYRSTILKFTFLMNFIDHQNLLKTLSNMSGQDIHAIIEEKKSKKLFERVLGHILKHADLYNETFIQNSFVTILLSSIQHENNRTPNLNINTEFHNTLSHISAKTNTLDHTNLQLYSILNIADNWNHIDAKMQSLYLNILPTLHNSALGNILEKPLIQNNIAIPNLTTQPSNQAVELASQLDGNFNKITNKLPSKEIPLLQTTILSSIEAQSSASQKLQISDSNKIQSTNIETNTPESEITKGKIR